MQFKHPEILYALLLIIIPIIIHLFQLQRFVKTPFTNVQFLKRIKLQTRKSSTLKKWLVLLTRILAFTCIIIAFAQPFFSSTKLNKKHTTTIYLDNSWSMQLKNQEGELLKNATQEIVKNLNASGNISLITNDKVYKNLNPTALKNELLNINYTSKKIDFNTVLLKASQLNSNTSNTQNNVLYISDFQENNPIKKPTSNHLNLLFVNLTKTNTSNIFIDSLYISKTSNKEISLKVILKNNNTEKSNLSVSLYNNNLLVGKTTTPIIKNKNAAVTFNIKNDENFNGKIIIEDDVLSFDNTFFFTISKPTKINVFSIGKTSAYLTKIYTKNEFNLIQKNLKNLDYNSLQNQQLIILNELEKIPNSLISTLAKFSENGGNLVIIPSTKSNINSYNNLYNVLKIGTISKPIAKELKITTLHFAHELLNDVFESKVSNFQYPTTHQYYKLTSNNATAIASFENEKPFLVEVKNSKNRVYIFASAINKNNSNFTNSPLIVPIFYNFGKYSFKIPKLYYTLGKENKIDVKVTVKKDEILQLKNELVNFIPLQQTFYNKVQLTTYEQPTNSGFYKIHNKNNVLGTIAFNNNRKESDLKYLNLENIFNDTKNISISNSIAKTMLQLSEQQNEKPAFKWFLAFGILFLLLEIFILKFFKI